MIKNVLFDLDGTLTDPAEGITKSVAYALNKFNIYVSDLSVLNVFIGPPLTDSFKNYFDFSEEEAQIALKTYREYFSEIGMFENKVYDGIPKLLKKLQDNGIRVCLATSKPEKYAVEILKYFDLYKYFYFVAGNTMDEQRSRKEILINYIFENNPNFKAEETVMVGDRKYDIEGGIATGIKTVGVSYGYAEENELETANPTKIANSVKELEEILVNM